MSNTNIKRHLPLPPKQFQKKILTWYDRHGRKALPWKQNQGPYPVWVSEIMLQQTQVNTVMPYFARFMQAFPNVAALACATEDDVLHHWTGLGYYQRARCLHKTAKIIMTQFAGEFPQDFAALQGLPGIGRSTAGAIMALAFHQKAAILDGNVKRVMARFHGITGFVNEKETENILWDLAETYAPDQRIADYTQAMMDLGAAICTRKTPQCSTCPLARPCYARLHEATATLPRKKPPRGLPLRESTFLVLRHGNEVLLNKRPPSGIWGGLWSFPEMAGPPDLKALRRFCKAQLGHAITNCKPLPSFRHTFTHFHLQIHPVLAECRRPAIVKTTQKHRPTAVWFDPIKPLPLGLPRPAQRILRRFA